MKPFVFLCFTALFIIGCTNINTDKNHFIIKGDIKNMPDGKIYLYDVATFKAPIDSTDMKDGSFSFTRTINKIFFPFEASIRYKDTAVNSFLHGRPIGIKSVVDTCVIMSSFYVVNGLTVVKGAKMQFCINEVTPNKQNTVFCKYVLKDFGYIDYSKNRGSQIQSYQNVIKQYPYSFYLLKSLIRLKLNTQTLS